MKDVPSFKRSIQPSNETFITSKQYIYANFQFLLIISGHLDPDSTDQNQKYPLDPDPQHWLTDKKINFQYYI